MFKDISDITTQTEVVQVLSFMNFAGRYIWAMNNADLDTIKILGLTSIKKYLKHAGQVKLKLD